MGGGGWGGGRADRIRSRNITGNWNTKALQNKRVTTPRKDANILLPSPLSFSIDNIELGVGAIS